MIGEKPLILIVEDDEDLAKLNARLLMRQGYSALIAYCAADAREIVKDNEPDLFILDIALPDGDGLTLCNEFREDSDAPVLFLTGKSSLNDKVSGLDAGGDYYLTKPHDNKEFIAVVQSLLRRVERTKEMIAEASVITKGPLTLKLNEKKVYVDGQDAELTAKEYSVLQLLVENEGSELTYEELYKAVWEAPMNGDSSALRKQISRVKKKLGEENTDDFAILNEHGKGYTFYLG